MIRAISEIGKLCRNEVSIIDEILKKDKYDYAFILEINLNSHEIDVDIFENLSEEQIRKLKWVGNFPGNRCQGIMTTDRLEYLITQSIPCILENLKKIDNLKNSELKEVLDVFLTEGFITTDDKKYKYILDIGKFRGKDGLEITRDKTKEMLDNIKSFKLEEVVESIKNDILVYVKGREGLSKLPEKLLFSLRIKGKINNKEVEVGPEHRDYISYLEELFVMEFFKNPDKGLCHICGNGEKISDFKTHYFKLLKFYITDKKGFASNFSEKNFIKNFGICKDCYENLLVGEKFVLSNLKLNYEKVNLYIFPELLSYNTITKDNLQTWSNAIRVKVGILWWESVEKLKDYLKNDLEKEREQNKNNFFLINLVFATPDRSAVKVDRVIYDIPPSKLDELIEVQGKVYSLAENFFKSEDYWNLKLENMLYLLPIRKRKNVIEIKEFLEFLDNLISGRKFDKMWLLSKFVDTARIHRYRDYNNYVQGNAPYAKDEKKDKKEPLVIFLLQSNLLLYYLRILCQIETKGGECAMCDELLNNVDNEKVDNKKLLEYVNFLELEPVERGLFLLGYLVAQIGKEQYKEGSEDKPILNKINFQSMNEEKVKILLNEVLEKLRQYKLLNKYNETIYSVAKCYLDGNREKLKDGINNVYWILSGYAYGTYKAITSGKKEGQDGSQEQ